jgi:hypothetical protein
VVQAYGDPVTRGEGECSGDAGFLRGRWKDPVHGGARRAWVRTGSRAAKPRGGAQVFLVACVTAWLVYLTYGGWFFT